MTATTFDTEKTNAVEMAVCSEFGCSISQVYAFKDTMAKKVVVFLLSRLYGYDKRLLAKVYSMSYMYVPTVVMEMEYMCKVVAGFKLKIECIENLIAYGKVMD